MELYNRYARVYDEMREEEEADNYVLFIANCKVQSIYARVIT